jgi:ADP-heptose:LPS heptosyltransferase
MTRTIVMIHPGGLGDVLMAVPAMTRLRTRFPKHRLLLCAEDQVARLLLACGIIDEWISMQGRLCADLFAGANSSMGQVQTWLEDCDLAIGWMEDLDGKLSATLKAVGIRQVIVRSPFSTSIQATHQVDRFLEVVDEAPSDNKGDVLLTMTEPIFRLGQVCLESTGLSSRQLLVVIHPGSGSIQKCVAPEVLASVVVALEIFGATPVILEGPADREPVDRFLRSCVNPPIVLKDLDLLTLAGVLAQARLFVGQDSGVTHMAGLIGVHTIALFGPTDPARWAPRGVHVTVVHGAPCLCQSWGDVTRCEEKPCLKMPQDHLTALCLTHLKETAVHSRIPSVPCH